jgi:hypothetical protein
MSASTFQGQLFHQVVPGTSQQCIVHKATPQRLNACLYRHRDYESVIVRPFHRRVS